MTEVGDETGFDSQTAFVLPIEGTEETSYLYMGDRWGNASGGVANDSEYVWLPIEFPTDESMELEWTPSWRSTPAQAPWNPATGDGDVSMTAPCAPSSCVSTHLGADDLARLLELPLERAGVRRGPPRCPTTEERRTLPSPRTT